MDKTEIFLLTKPPHSDRTKLCLHLMEDLENAVLYLAGDGVYNLLEASSLEALSKENILACEEDLKSRGVQAEGKVTVSVDFYKRLVDEMMRENSRIYVF
jgi:tRNA 2-thiouridine synthesizing protein B